MESQQTTTHPADDLKLVEGRKSLSADRDQSVPRLALPKTMNSIVLRTDFSDDAAWESICAAIRQPSKMGYRAYVDCVSDRAFDGLTVEQLLALSPKGSSRSFAFVVDRTTLTHQANPVLVVDLFTEPGRRFRVIPSEMWSVENNLSLANMDFSTFAEKVDGEGIHRGF